MSVPANDVPAAPAGALPGVEERQWAMFAHLSAFSAFVTGIGAIFGPLIIWQIKKNQMPFVDDQGKEALNFNLTLFIVCVVLAVFSFVTLGIGLLLTVPAFALIFLAWLVLTIIAGIKANNGEAYRYPFAIRLIK